MKEFFLFMAGIITIAYLPAIYAAIIYRICGPCFSEKGEQSAQEDDDESEWTEGDGDADEQAEAWDNLQKTFDLLRSRRVSMSDGSGGERHVYNVDMVVIDNLHCAVGKVPELHEEEKESQ